MNPASQLTVTTACDANYFWGAFLMVGTLRQHGIPSPANVLADDFSAEQKSLLAQFGGVSVLPLPGGSRNLVLAKPGAMLTGDTDWLAWIDADCVFTGDVSAALIPPNGEAQIRLRAPFEVAAVYRGRYRAGEPHRGVPREILARWREDVGELAEPRLDSICPSNVIIVHRRFRPFLERWRAQMERVLAPGFRGVVDQSNRAYHQTDESVLNSLLTFSAGAPSLDRRYLLDDVSGPHIGHFIGSPKPWQRWNWRALNWYETVLSFLDWCRAKGYRTPPLPASFSRSRKLRSYAIAGAENVFVQAKRRAGAIYRSRFPPKGAP